MIPLAAMTEHRARLAALPLAREFPEAAASAGWWPLTPAGVTTLQINVGKLCNQTCRHCHVDAGPDRREVMSRETMAPFNPATVAGVMCRSMISVGWDGRLYDCDFNQMLDLAVDGRAPQHIRDFDLAALARRHIVVGRHCFGCTAGTGSSCGGSIK